MTMQAAVIQARHEDDVSSLRNILEATQSATTRSSYLHSALRTAIRQNSLLVLTYLLNFGVDLTTLGGSDIQSKGVLKPILELLLAYGWHIDTRTLTGNNRQPLGGPLLHGTPLDYVSEVCFSSRNACCEDVTWLLLDAGADVTRARHGTRASLDLPLEEDIIPFVEAVEKWQRRRCHITDTSIQCEAEKNGEILKTPASCSMT